MTSTRASRMHDEYSSWFLWPMVSFQVYPGNVLNTYHWRAVDAGHVVVWRGWYSVGGIDDEKVRLLAQAGSGNHRGRRHSPCRKRTARAAALAGIGPARW